MYLVLSGISRKYIVLFSLIIFLPSCDRSTYEIHMNAFVADAHNNILLKAMDGQNILTYLNHTHSDLEKFKTGGVDLQAFTVWVDPEKFTDKDYFLRADNMISKLEYLCSRIPNNWKIIKSYQDINNNIRRNIMSCMIGVEGGHVIGKDINKIEYLYDRGMRYFGITSDNSNYIGTSARDETLKRFKLNKMGLTNFGRKVISECNRLGIMVDISHVGEKTFWDVVNIANKPLIASHSSVYKICPNYMNLKDDQLKAIQNNGGVVFINFYPGYIDSTYSSKEELINLKYEYQIEKLADNYDTSSTSYLFAKTEILKQEKSKIVPTINEVVNHIEYVSDLIGVNHVGIGSNFDGVDIMPAGLENVSKLPFLTKKLLDRGFTIREVRKILGDNFKRVFKEVNN